MASFSKSIGGSYGSGPINAESVGLGQASGGPVGGYSGTNGKGAGAVPSMSGVAKTCAGGERQRGLKEMTE